MKTLRYVTLAVFLVVTVLSAGASGSQEEAEQTKGPVTVASKIDTEGALLGNMIVQLLEADGFEVEDSTEFGPTDVIRKAIINGEIDLYPEYTGNGAFFYDDSPDDVWNDPEAGYETIKELDMEEHGIVWLQPASANNTWAIAVRSDLAEEEDLETLDDLADYIEDGGTFKFAASEEFVTRPDTLPAFEEAYGFELSEDQLLTFSGGNTATTTQAAARGTDDVNAAMAYGTDGNLGALDLTVLEDSRNVQPYYLPAPIVRSEVLDEYPEIESILEPLFSSLDLETLQELNARIAVQGEDAGQVAESYLTENGFLE
ncbi:MAG: glycine betaine ABC transporter substrate-binding protein OsmF [Spirochaetota bacterium]